MIVLAKQFRHWPIRKKMSAIIVLAVWLGSLIASSLLIIYDRNSEEANLKSELETLLKIVSQSTSAALAFEDIEAATKNLSFLSQNQDFANACLYDRSKQKFAVFNGNPMLNCKGLSSEESAPMFKDGFLSATRPVFMRNTKVGYLELHLSLENLENRFRQFVVVSIIVQLFSSLIAYLLTVRVQTSITGPIISLADTAEKITRSEDFTLRAEKINDDELGALVKTFNLMLGKIQQTNHSLKEALEELGEEKLKSDESAMSANTRAKAIREFFAGASHDLRQPLHAMGLFLDALKADSSVSLNSALLNKLDQSIFNMSTLFNDLLDVSKLEAKLSKPDLKPVNLASLIDKVTTDFEILASDKGLRFSVFSKALTVSSDERMLERIIRNLLSNAIRYTSRGGVILSVRSQGENIAIEVWDTGRGISDDKKDIIFEEYVQLEEEDAKKGGFGLGLSIVYRLAALLEHKLSFRSIEGKGTCFKLLIRDEQKAVSKSNISRETQANITTGPASVNPLEGKKVLAIDDDEDVLDALSSILENWGMRVFQTSSAEAAIDVVNRAEFFPEIVISDFRLGSELTGDKVIQYLRESLGAGLPAIIVTGESSMDSLNAIEKSGITYLSKPVKAAKLRALVNYVLSKSKR